MITAHGTEDYAARLVEAQTLDDLNANMLWSIARNIRARVRAEQGIVRAAFKGTVKSPVVAYVSKAPDTDDSNEIMHAAVTARRLRAPTLLMHSAHVFPSPTTEASLSVTRLFGEVHYDGVPATAMPVDERVTLAAEAAAPLQDIAIRLGVERQPE